MYTHIVHLADIHIRTNRQEEYIQVFDKLFQSICDNTDKPLIIVCGDVIHNKIKITPEVIKLTNYFLNGLGSISKTVLISGNHDLVENNFVRDKFLSVLKKHSNVDYIDKTDEYIYDNITLGISTLDDKKFIAYQDIKNNNNFTLAVGHYMLEELGLPGFDKCVADFQNYDYALLGDIHQHSFYKNCVYSGSLIQQNYGENTNKGYGIININSRKYKHIPILNDYSFLTLKVDKKSGDLIIPKDTTFTKYTNLRIFRDDTYRNNDNEYLKIVSSKTDILDYVIDTKYKKFKQEDINEVTMLDIDDDTNILKELLGDHENKDEILVQHSAYKNNINSYTKNSKKFYIKNLTFKNIFNFTKQQSLDLNKLQGVLGLLGRNASGKSNILRIIIFALCGNIMVDYSLLDDEGKKSKSQTLHNKKKYEYDNVNIINKNAKSCTTIITFYYGNCEFKVTRELTKTTRTTTSSVNFEKLLNGKWESCIGENKRETDNIIHNMVGKSTIFLLLNVYNKYTSSLITCSPKERYNILSSLLNLGIYVTIHEKVNKDIKELIQRKSQIEGIMNHANKQIADIDLVENIDMAEKEIRFIEKTIEKLQKSYTSTVKPSEKVLDNSHQELINLATIKNKNIDSLLKITLDLPKGDIANESSTSFNLLYDKYSRLRHIKNPKVQIPNVIEPLPPACNTGVTENQLLILKEKLDKYNYIESEIDKNNLITILTKHKRKFTFIEPSINKQNLDINSLLGLTDTSRYPNVDTLDENKLQEIIDNYTNSHINQIESLEQEILELNIPEKRLIKNKRKILVDRESLDSSIDESFNIVHNFMNIEEILKDLNSKSPKKYVINKIKKLQNINEVLIVVSSQISEKHKLIQQFEYDTAYNKSIDEDIEYNLNIDELINKKNKKLTLLRKIKDYEKNYSDAIKNIALIRHNKIIDSLLPYYQEINRRLSYIKVSEEYNKKLYEYKQYVAYQKEQLDQYEELQKILPELRYFNNKNISEIKNLRAGVADINNTILVRIKQLSHHQDDLRERLIITKQYNESKINQEELDNINNTLLIKLEYQRLISKGDGIQDYIINHYLTNISKHINSMLDDMVKYNIKFELDNSNINLHIIKHSMKLQPSQLSGYEGFIADIVTKVIINKYTHVGSSEFFAIDEGLGVIDSENFECFIQLLNKMKNYYKNIIIISHIDEATQLVDLKVEVKKNELFIV